MEQEIVYSYHMFMFPFIWETGKVTVNKRKEIREFFETSSNKYWRALDWKKRTTIKEQAQYYANKQYFHPAARMAVFGDEEDKENSIVNNFEFCPEFLGDGAEYIIRKEPEYGEEKEFHLPILRIELKVFNTGVATFFFECKNTCYDTIEDIKMINDYGRRISIPHIPLKSDNKPRYWNGSSCADSLEILLPKVPELKAKDDFKQRIVDFNEGKIGEDEVECHFCEAIVAVMNAGNRRNKFTTSSKSEGDIVIEPALDDRMYVMSQFNQRAVHTVDTENQDFFTKLSCGMESAEEYLDELEEENMKKEESLYAYAFVDADSCTCQSKKMRRELLDASSYDRWINYGSYYSITPQAFNCISDFGLTINSFRNLYPELGILALVQRATLINFQNKALELSKGLEKVGKGIDQEKIKELMDLQERFIAFQNQLNLQEISSQEQAIEIYQLLRKFEFVDELNEAITSQLDALYDATNTNQDFSFNKWAVIMACFALGIDIPTFIVMGEGYIWPFTLNANPLKALPHYGFIGITFILIIILFIKFRREGSKKCR